MKIEVEENTITCPKCGAEQRNGTSCRHCGIVFHKYVDRSKNSQKKHYPPVRQSSTTLPFRALIRVSQLMLLASLLLLILSYQYKDQLPQADFYGDAPLSNPVQTDTSVEPFEIEANDIVYTINPVQDYQLNGVVVSFHNSDTWWDIYHHGSWQDFVNIKDICIIWGDNVTSGVYQKMSFKNTTWTCWASWPDRDTGKQFSMYQLSNNHLLVGDAHIRQIAENVELGDQIRLEGVLASYSHSNNQFTRGTSTSRTDTGNGACETIYLSDFEIVKKANPGWRKINLLAWWLVALILICLIVLVYKSPVQINE